MGTIEEKLQKVINSKETIRASIEGKGVSCSADIPFAQFAEKINAITGGGIGFAACLPNYEKIDVSSEVRFVAYEKVILTPTEG